MANTYYWIKLYYDLLDDWKVGNLPDSLKWRFIQCLLVAGEAREDGFLPPLEKFAYRIRPITPESLNDDLSRLARPGLVELKMHPDGTERWFVTKFLERQSSRSNAERQQAWRSRQSSTPEQNGDSNDSVTDERQDSNEDVTTRYLDKIRLDKDIDKDSDEIRKEYTPAFEHIPPEVNEFITALSAISKTTYWPKTEEQYRDAATTLIHIGATVDEIKSFGQWWKNGGSYYKDDSKPSITSVMGSWQDFKDGVIPGKKTGNNGQEYQLPPEYKDIIKR